MCPAPPAQREGPRWPGSSEARPAPRRGLTTTSGLRQRAAEQGESTRRLFRSLSGWAEGRGPGGLGNTRQLWSVTSSARRVLPTQSGAPGARRAAPPTQRVPHLPGPETSGASRRCSESRGRPSGPPPHCRGQGRAETPRAPQEGETPSKVGALRSCLPHTRGTCGWCRKACRHTCCPGTPQATPGRHAGRAAHAYLELCLETQEAAWGAQAPAPTTASGLFLGACSATARNRRLRTAAPHAFPRLRSCPDLPPGVCPASDGPEAPRGAVVQRTLLSSYSTL